MCVHAVVCVYLLHNQVYIHVNMLCRCVYVATYNIVANA